MNKKFIYLENVSKRYDTNPDANYVLKNVNLEIQQKGFYGVVGHSGCGKSTILNLIGCMDKPSDGVIHIKGNNTNNFNDTEMSYFRNSEIGFIFQQYNLIKRLTVLKNMQIPIFYNNKKRADEKNIDAMLEYVGLNKKLLSYPNELSGGEQQRVAIARALINEPDILLADEPTGNLDDKNTFYIMELFKKLNEEKGLTIIMVTHNNELLKYCSNILRIENGEVLK
jgi:putative ABC transport system ATP-binding protein